MAPTYTPAAIAALVAAAENARSFLTGAPYEALCEALRPFTAPEPPMFSDYARARWGPAWTMGRAKAQAIGATWVTQREYDRAAQDYRDAYGREPW